MAVIFKWILTYAIIRTLISIGVGVITYGAVITTIVYAIGQVKAAYNTMPVEVLQFLALAGMPQVFGIICGAVIARTTLQFTSRIGRLPV